MAINMPVTQLLYSNVMAHGRDRDSDDDVVSRVMSQLHLNETRDTAVTDQNIFRKHRSVEGIKSSKLSQAMQEWGKPGSW